MKVWEFDCFTFADTLRQLRLDKNMTQEELAKKLWYCSISTVKNYEAGVALPTTAKLIELCRVLGVDEIRINPSRSVIPFDRKMRGDV